MRIIAGNLGGRNFESPRGNRTHPMSDKIRGALFNALGDIDGLTVFDAFAGSGAISYEAVSRGAKRVTAIDNDRNAQQAIANNLSSLGITNVRLIKSGAGAWLNKDQTKFDIVILDPPYDFVQSELLVKLAARTKPQAIVVISLPPTDNFVLKTDYELLQSKNYGDATLAFYRRLS